MTGGAPACVAVGKGGATTEPITAAVTNERHPTTNAVLRPRRSPAKHRASDLRPTESDETFIALGRAVSPAESSRMTQRVTPETQPAKKQAMGAHLDC